MPLARRLFPCISRVAEVSRQAGVKGELHTVKLACKTARSQTRLRHMWARQFGQFSESPRTRRGIAAWQGSRRHRASAAQTQGAHPIASAMDAPPVSAKPAKPQQTREHFVELPLLKSTDGRPHTPKTAKLPSSPTMSVSLSKCPMMPTIACFFHVFQSDDIKIAG